MQKQALTDDNQVISALVAKKKSTYFCLSCKGPVRLRSGPLRISHFYHTRLHCSASHPKSAEHIHVQNLLLKELNQPTAFTEKAFPLIGRIADVALLQEQLVFEVQCSKISKKEVKSRIREYNELGFNVIWILHDRTFNRTFLSPAERYLLSRPHYYTNINQEGKGFIYDQFAIHRGKALLYKGRPLPLNLKRFTRSLVDKTLKGHLGHQLKLRKKRWGISFAGDLYQLAAHQKGNRPRKLIDRIYPIKEFLKKILKKIRERNKNKNISCKKRR